MAWGWRGTRGARGAVAAAASVAASVAVAVAVAALTSCGDAPARGGVVAVGQPAPAYAAQRLDGTPVTLAEQRDNVVMLNVWATWCKPCREEIPALDSLHREFGARGLRIVGVSIDVSSDTAMIAGFARELGASYELWLDPDDRASFTFRALGVPSTHLVDRAGTLRWRHMGPVRASDAGLRALLDSVLSEPSGR
ncbi:MAG: TlpA family protein disulfide reductase [Gemmatimonadaceae bacterium]|nr:TlpA family protein disulfide reductase [Gemmatimonadaceae bacterium]MCW5827571.1 TlpA family protein disulfide reductase [Gemmatimonadaceae bacterium]